MPSLTRYRFLPPISAAEARHSTGDDHHETDADSAHYQEELQVDLAVLAGKPGIAVAGHIAGLQDTLTVPVAQLALGGRPAADSAWESSAVRPCSQVEVARHAGACVRPLRVATGGAVGTVVVLRTGTLVKVINGHPGDHDVGTQREVCVLQGGFQRLDAVQVVLPIQAFVAHFHEQLDLHVVSGVPVGGLVLKGKVSLCVVADLDGGDL